MKKHHDASDVSPSAGTRERTPTNSDDELPAGTLAERAWLEELQEMREREAHDKFLRNGGEDS